MGERPSIFPIDRALSGRLIDLAVQQPIFCVFHDASHHGRIAPYPVVMSPASTDKDENSLAAGAESFLNVIFQAEDTLNFLDVRGKPSDPEIIHLCVPAV